MGEGWAAVILKRANHWVGIDLVAGSSEKTGAIVITDIVAVRGNGTA